jgi:hypothetical protein
VPTGDGCSIHVGDAAGQAKPRLIGVNYSCTPRSLTEDCSSLPQLDCNRQTAAIASTSGRKPSTRAPSVPTTSALAALTRHSCVRRYSVLSRPFGNSPGSCAWRRPPDLALVVEQAREAALFLHERAVRLRHARLAHDVTEHVQRRFRVVRGAVSAFQGDAEPLGYFGQGAALPVLLGLSRPHQRVDPLDVVAERRRRIV